MFDIVLSYKRPLSLIQNQSCVNGTFFKNTSKSLLLNQYLPVEGGLTFPEKDLYDPMCERRNKNYQHTWCRMCLSPSSLSLACFSGSLTSLAPTYVLFRSTSGSLPAWSSSRIHWLHISPPITPPSPASPFDLLWLCTPLFFLLLHRLRVIIY